MMLVYPLLVLPFVTMVFWALGGGAGEKSEKPIASSGINVQLPNAHLKDDNAETKLSYYEEADRNSLRDEKDMGNGQSLTYKDPNDTSHFYLTPNGSKSPGNFLQVDEYHDKNEENVYQKLAELNQQLNTSSTRHYTNSEDGRSVDNYVSPETNNQVEKLDQLMRTISTADTAADPEMKDLNSMMDKILDIQHPERVQNKQEGNAVKDKEKVFAVTNHAVLSSISLLDTTVKKQNNNAGFFGLEEESGYKEQNAIEAVVHENQLLVNGSVIKLRISSDISVNGNTIPKGNFIFGIVSLNGERLEIEVSSIKYQHDIFPIKLNVYDLDGLPGIYIPGAITRDVAKQSLNNATQMMELSSLDPSLKAQATSAGINTVKSLLSKKVKMVRVTVKAGYKILLK